MRLGSVHFVRGLNVPTPEAPPAPETRDATIASAVATRDGGVVFDLPAPPEVILPARVDFHYVPPGSLPDDVASVEEIAAQAVASGSVDTGVAGQYTIPAPAIPPGDYDVALVCLFSE